ncbi:hypothetical protein ACH42_03285 [Endozoicomonas sp. (ex Bugula neritina AB1)]|nr:hypothetical protein ACH42_03285 [Endozoicomonas sp. (ex Bugula neritina AB1)]
MVLCAGCRHCHSDDAAMRALILFTLLLVSSLAQAEDYYWELSYAGKWSAPTPLEAANLYLAANPPCTNQSPEGQAAKLEEVRNSVQIAATGTYANIKIWTSSCYSYHRTIQRYGDSCPEGAIYNTATGGCDGAPSCSGAKPVSSHTQGKTACYNQCGYTTLGGFRDFDNALSPLVYEYVPTGDSCSGNEAVELLSDASEYTETNEDNLSCRINGSTQICISADESCKLINGIEVCIDNQTREDLMNCGTFNGEVVCFEKNAYSNCKYVKGEYLCVYPEGNKIDSASVDHPGNGGNANGDDKDDILDQQDLTENSPHAQSVKNLVAETNAKNIAQKQADNDLPKTAFSGIECDKTVSCTGDAIQCAMARMQKKQLCLSEFNESEVQKIISDNPQMSPLGTLAGDNLEIHVDDFLDTEEYVTADNQCPEPLSFSVLGTEYQIALTPLCDLASYISYFILFATWFSMAVILAKSLSTA